MWQLIATLSALAACGLAHAQAAAPVLAYYEFCLNGRCGDPAMVASESDGRHWLEEGALQARGLDTADWPRREVDGVVYVDPAGRFAEADIAIDAAALRLSLTLPAQAWAARDYNVRRGHDRPRAIPAPGHSAYLDYTIYRHGDAPLSAYGEIGAVRGAWLLRSSFDHDGDALRRGVSALEYERWAQRQRWTLGDQYLSPGDAFGAAGLLGGVGVASAFELDPYLVTFPGADVRGVMQAPGTVEVYANGQLVSRLQVQPGPFSLRDLALSQGSNDVRIVVNDPFAGSYEVDTRFYASVRGLARGLHDYGYHVGRLRPDLREGYGDDTFVSARHRYGFTDWLTAGARYQRVDGRENAGLSLDLRLPLGAVSLATARSRVDGVTGWAHRADYTYLARRFGVTAGWRHAQASYAPLRHGEQLAGLVDSTGERYLSLSWMPVAGTTLAARHARLEYPGGASLGSTALRLGRRLPGGGQLSLEAGRRDLREGGREDYWQAAWHQPLGEGMAGVNAGRVRGQSLDVVASWQRSAPLFTSGWGYRLEAGRVDGAGYGYADVEHASRIGRGEISVEHRRHDTLHTARFTGSLLWADGGVYPVQTGTRGHALVRTGLPGVPVLREHQLAGATDARGRLLVPGLLPYLANRVSIDDEALDIGLQVDDPERHVAVRSHGVAYIDFDVRPVTAAQLFLAVDGRRLQYGRARLRGRDDDGVRIGSDGQVYLEGLSPGAHVLTVTSEDGTGHECRFDVPAGEALAWIGEVPCTPR